MSKLPLSFLFIVITVSLNAQFLWQQNYPNLIAENHLLRSQIATPDGNYLIYGSQKITPGLDPRFIQKIDDQGSLLWKKVIDSTTYGIPLGICATFDGNFMLPSATIYDLKLTKVSPTGDIIWIVDHAQLGLGNPLSGNQITNTAQGGFIVAGSNIQTTNNRAIMVLKADSLGQEIWKNKYFATNDQNSEEYGTTILETADGSILVAGVSITTNDVILLKIDKDGNQLWSQIYDYSSSFEIPTQIEPSPDDDGFYIFGMENDLTLNKPTVLKVDLDGNAEWQKNYGQGTMAELPTKMTFTSDCNMVITHGEDLDQATASVLIKLDYDGNELCTYLLDQGVDTDFRPLDISEKPNEELIVVGTIKDCSTCLSQIFSLGTTNLCDSLNCATSILEQSISSSVSVYPNPNNGIINIESKFTNAGILYLDVFDMTGLKINSTQQVVNDFDSSQKTTLDIRSFPKGIFYLKTQFGNEFQVFKIVVQ